MSSSRNGHKGAGEMSADKNPRSYDKSNGNNEMLNFNDNYAMILQKLANDNSHLLTQDLNSEAIGASDGLSNNNIECNHGNNLKFSGGNGNDRQNLDSLFQHYQSLLTRSASHPRTSAGASVGDNKGHRSDVCGSVDGNSRNWKSTTKNNGNNSKSGGNKSMITERPCDHCRRRQTKCVLVPDLADCVQCETKGIKCTFSDMPSNVNKFVRGGDIMNGNGKHQRQDSMVDVEGLLKRARTNNNGSVAQYYAELLQNLNESMNNNSSNSNSVDIDNNKNKTNSVSSTSSPMLPHSNDFMNLMRQSHQQRSLPMQYQSLPPQSAGQYPRSSLYVGPTSAYDINLINHIKLDNIDQVQLSSSLSLRKVAPDILFVLRDNFNEQIFLQQEREVDMVEKLVYPHGKVLIDIFFRLVHPCFPILHERVFLEKYSRSYRELTAPLLASIYSLSIQWWDFHPKLIGFPKPDVVDQLNEIAYRTFFQMTERPKLSIVQTGLLMLQCRSEYSNNWVLCSALVALCEELGLGIDCQDWRLPRWERGLRRRLAWAIWVQEKWTALVESRNSHLILGRNWMVKLLTEEDFPQNSPIISGSQASMSRGNIGGDASLGNMSLIDMSLSDEDFISGNLMFQQLVSLTVILGEIMDTFYTEGAAKLTTRIEQVLKLAKPLQLKLREWYHSLPPQLSMSKFVPRKFNPNASLTLAYFAAEITLHRKIISTLDQDTPKELVQICRTAAKTRLIAAIEFIRDLKSEHINAFWYTCSTGNLMLIAIFAALLYVTAQTREDAMVVRDYLRNYIWILRVGSKSFDRSGNALKRIHVLLSQIPGLLTDEQPREFVPARSQSPVCSVSQQWKVPTMTLGSPSNDSQPVSPTLKQLRGMSQEILQKATGLPGDSPGFTINKSTAQSSPADLLAHTHGDRDSYHNYDEGNEGKQDMKMQMNRCNSFPRDHQLKNKEQSIHTEHQSPDPVVDTSSTGVNGSVDKNIIDPSTLTQNPRGKPITPQSVNGNLGAKENSLVVNGETLDQSTATGGSSSASPSPASCRIDAASSASGDVRGTSPKNLPPDNEGEGQDELN